MACRLKASMFCEGKALIEVEGKRVSPEKISHAFAPPR
jgi:hypothetical protein